MVGIDIIEVDRIEQGLKKKGFLQRLLTKQEIEYVNQFKSIKEHIAGFFCAKEAVMKALEDCKEISFLDIEIFHKQNGKPFIKLYGKAAEVFLKSGYSVIEISISQTKTYATAIAILK